VSSQVHLQDIIIMEKMKSKVDQVNVQRTKPRLINTLEVLEVQVQHDPFWKISFF
jgi:hypothetical protein